MLAGIEAGGTKIVCAVGPDPHTVLRRASIPTESPDKTLAAIASFLNDRAEDEAPVRAIGIGSFGPLDLDPASLDFGAVTRTPKPGWSGVNMRTYLATALQCPVAIDTDVNASGLAEAAVGAGKGLSSMAYVTVGTGIGGGLIVGGKPLHGLTHPEMGHIHPRRHAADNFEGACPFHKDCLEGLASGSATYKRLGHTLSELPAADPMWEILADYLGQLCATLVLTASPARIVLGGGMMDSNPSLFAPIRSATQHWLAGYVHHPAITDTIDRYIVPPKLGSLSGITGALMMAEALTA